ncbi:T9SS type A sorting domain-containing protein [candidate division KSB1 bacterium]|nr:T9SS type A sorting domain-containing protein [candidate division KSB1 bacterium]
MFIKQFLLLIVLISINAYTQEVTVSGFMYDAVEKSPLEGTEIEFERIDENFEIRTYSDKQGYFSLSIPPGTYLVTAYTYGYLIPPKQIYDIDSNIENFDIGFSTSDYILSKNSVDVNIPKGSTVTEKIMIENAGSGNLFFSTAVAKTKDELLVLSKKANTQQQRPKLPVFKINGVLPKPGEIKSALAPDDTLWELVYRDPEDNPGDFVDIHEIFMQVNNNILYIKTTFFRPITLSYGDFIYSLLIDTDGDRNTGDDSGWNWIGPEFGLSMSDFGQGPMAVLIRSVHDEWNYVRNADYSRLRSNEFICGINLNSLGTIKMLSFFAAAEHNLHPGYDDMAPDWNTGCFLYNPNQGAGVKLTPLFNTLEASAKDTLILTVNSTFFEKGINQRFLLITSNDPTKLFNVFPLFITVQSSNYTAGAESRDTCLLQNYPNHCNPVTTIPYVINDHGFVSLKVYNMLGEEIETLINVFQNSGSHKAFFDGSRYPNGVYLYKLQIGHFQQIRKFILLK